MRCFRDSDHVPKELRCYILLLMTWIELIRCISSRWIPISRCSKIQLKKATQQNNFTNE